MMAYVYKRGDKWYIGFRDNRGQCAGKACSAREQDGGEAHGRRARPQPRAPAVRAGAVPCSDGGGTFGALLRWWLKTYSAKSPSHDRNVATIEKHFLAPRSRSCGLQEVTPAVMEVFLEEKAGELAPQTLNHLRRFIAHGVQPRTASGPLDGPQPGSGRAGAAGSEAKGGLPARR